MEFVRLAVESLAFCWPIHFSCCGRLLHFTWSQLFPIYSNRLIYYLGVLLPSTIGETAKGCSFLVLSCIWKDRYMGSESIILTFFNIFDLRYFVPRLSWIISSWLPGFPEVFTSMNKWKWRQWFCERMMVRSSYSALFPMPSFPFDSLLKYKTHTEQMACYSLLSWEKRK